MAHPALTFEHERNTSNTMSERHAQHSHLTMEGTYPRTMSERTSTYIHHHDRTHLLPSVERIALTSTSMIGHTYYHLWKGSALISDHVGTNPIVTSEWLLSLS